MKQAKKNWLIFTPGSLQYCSQNYCTVVPEMTVFLFAEITAFLFPVYKYFKIYPHPCKTTFLDNRENHATQSSLGVRS